MKYPILPPGYKHKVPDGYIPLPSQTYTGFAALRSNVESGSAADVARAVAYRKRVKFYPLSKAANPPQTTFVDAIDVVFDNTIPYDLRFLEALDRFVQREPWLERDKAMIDSLKTIGIEKGKPFKPDAKTQKILGEAVREAQAWLDHKYEVNFSPPFNAGTHRALPATPEVAEAMQTGAATDFGGGDVGRQPDKGCHVPHVPARERRQDGLHPDREGRSRGRLLVRQRLQRPGLLPEERSRRVRAQLPPGAEERRRLGDHPGRRVRRQGTQLPPDHARLELHGAP